MAVPSGGAPGYTATALKVRAIASLLDPILDASVYWSFDRTGYLRHARRFDPADLDVDLKGRRFLVTGANSGIGREVARGLLQRGATVWLGCRDAGRGAAARAELASAADPAGGEARL